MCELGVVVVAGTADQIIGGERATEARAVVQQRRSRYPAFARIPRAVAGHRRGVREALSLLISE